MQTSDAFPLTTAPAHKDRLSCLGEIALYAAVFLLTTLLFLIVKPLYSVERDGVVTQAITACVIGGVAFVGIFLALEKKLTARRFAVLVLYARFGAPARYVYQKFRRSRGLRLDDFFYWKAPVLQRLSVLSSSAQRTAASGIYALYGGTFK